MILRAFIVWGLLTKVAGELLAYNACDGAASNVSPWVWDEVKRMISIDMAGKDIGSSLDPRSDPLEQLREVLNKEVLPDLDNAVKDCAFGVLSLILLTMVVVDSEEGLARARYLQDIADDLFVDLAEFIEDSEWDLDPSKFYNSRQLLRNGGNDCRSDLRVYIYNNSDLTQKRLLKGSGMMGAASHIHAWLEQSACTTEDPELADLFFLPAYHKEQQKLLAQARDVERFPYLERRPHDHFFVVTANLPSWPSVSSLRHSTMLTVESYQVNDDIPRWFSPWKDVMIPGYIDRWRIEAMRDINKPTDERGFLLVFHGNHPGNHPLYVKHNADIRTRILTEFAGLPDCSVGGPTMDFFERMGRTHFCLVPRGSSAWTIHLFESFFFGCIPVILSDQLEVPFQGIVDWRAFSIKWPERELSSLLAHLRSIPLDKVAEMKRNLEAAACFFDFHRGWGNALSGGLQWNDQVALSKDCSFVEQVEAETLEECRQRIGLGPNKSNLVNFRGGKCVLRHCRDPAQPALTTSPGWLVWAQVNRSQHECSPYHAIMRELELRHQNRPVYPGPFWK